MKLFHKQNYPSIIIQQEEWRTVNNQVVYFIKWQTGDSRLKFQCYSLYTKGNAELFQMQASAPISIVSDVEEHILRLFTGVVHNDK